MGNRARTVENFPRMKVRGGRRRHDNDPVRPDFTLLVRLIATGIRVMGDTFAAVGSNLHSIAVILADNRAPVAPSGEDTK